MLSEKLIQPEQLNDAQWRANNLPESWKIIELSPLEVFETGHIENSVHLDYKRTQPGTMPEPGGMLDKKLMSQLLSELGINADTTLILSDYEGGGWAGRFAWMLDVIGHESYAYLNGGLRSWIGAGFSTTTDTSTVVPSNYKVSKYRVQHSIDKDTLIEQLNQTNLVVWDSRSYAEHIGEKAVSAFAGRIPNAIHHEWTQLMDSDNHLRLKPLEEIRATLDKLGISQDTNIVTYCQSHHRSGLTYMVGKLLGLDIVAYAGGWAQWGNDPDTPKATGDA